MVLVVSVVVVRPHNFDTATGVLSIDKRTRAERRQLLEGPRKAVCVTSSDMNFYVH